MENNDENKVTNVFGGVDLGNNQAEEKASSIGFEDKSSQVFHKVEMNNGSSDNLPTKRGFWSKFKAFWLQEVDFDQPIKIELTPYQQRIEDEINEFLHQEVSLKRLHNYFSGKNNLK